MFRINSPVLVPFGFDLNVLEYLNSLRVDVYLYPQYKFLGEKIRVLVRDKPTKYMLDYIKQTIKDEIKSVSRTSDYFNLFDNMFDLSTAIFVDKVSQIEMDKKAKQVLLFYLIKELTTQSDDLYKFKKVKLDLNRLNDILTYENNYMESYSLDFADIKIVEYLGTEKFSCIYDSIIRHDRLYNQQFIAFVRVLSNLSIQEYKTDWESRLNSVLENNLLHGGYVFIKKYPKEITEKINKLFALRKYNKVEEGVWQKTDINTNKISKGIKTYY